MASKTLFDYSQISIETETDSYNGPPIWAGHRQGHLLILIRLSIQHVSAYSAYSERSKGSGTKFENRGPIRDFQQ